MGCCAGFSRIFLGIFNSIFLVFGLALLVIGCLVKFSPDFVSSTITPQLDKVDTRLDFVIILQDTTTVTIVLGSLLFFIGLTGTIGLACKSKILLTIYAISLSLILLGEIAVVAMMYLMNTQLTDYLKKTLNATIAENYQGSNSTEAITLTWNFVNYKFKCCGVNDYQDFHASTKWSRTAGEQVPVSCCKVTGKFPDLVVVDQNCVTSPTATNSYYNVSCYSQIEDVIIGNKVTVILCGAALMLVEFILIIGACFLCKEDQERDKFEPM